MFDVMRKNHGSFRILCPVKLSFRQKSNVNLFSRKQNHTVCISIGSLLKEDSKGYLGEMETDLKRKPGETQAEILLGKRVRPNAWLV